MPVAYTAPPIRVTELPAKKIATEPKPGRYIFDLGQNFARIIRLKVKGAAGTKLRIRYGEMLHKDGRLMIENLHQRSSGWTITHCGAIRKARQRNEPVLRSRFQYVEIDVQRRGQSSGLVTGLVVLNNDTPPIRGPVRVQRRNDEPALAQYGAGAHAGKANFIEVPLGQCPAGQAAGSEWATRSSTAPMRTWRRFSRSGSMTLKV